MNTEISEFICIGLFHEQDEVEKILQRLQNCLSRRCAVYLIETTECCRFTTMLLSIHTGMVTRIQMSLLTGLLLDFNLKRIMHYPFKNELS